jgi:hypothetical protein
MSASLDTNMVLIDALLGQKLSPLLRYLVTLMSIPLHPFYNPNLSQCQPDRSEVFYTQSILSYYNLLCTTVRRATVVYGATEHFKRG